MTEREMLERAARAAVVDLWHEDVFTAGLTRKVNSSGVLCWNPLTDDGDCARLEAACGLDVSWLDDRVEIGDSHADPVDWLLASASYADHGGDKNKARRYASTLAAATLGKSAAMDGEKK